MSSNISTRKIEDMAEMYGLPRELYTMKRGVKTNGDLRYDITIIPPLIINGHFNKTKGHIHSSGHTEEYIVLEGRALFMFQDKKNYWHILPIRSIVAILSHCYTRYAHLSVCDP